MNVFWNVTIFAPLNSLMNEVVHTSPTIGSNVEEVVWKNIHFLMWDIGGQESLRASWNTYYSNSEVTLPRMLVTEHFWVLEIIKVKIKRNKVYFVDPASFFWFLLT